MGVSRVIAKQNMGSNLKHFKSELLTSNWRRVGTDTKPGESSRCPFTRTSKEDDSKSWQGTYEHRRLSLAFIVAHMTFEVATFVPSEPVTCLSASLVLLETSLLFVRFLWPHRQVWKARSLL